MKRKDELKVTQSNFSPLLHIFDGIFEHQGKNCLGGLLQPPFGELGLDMQNQYQNIKYQNVFTTAPRNVIFQYKIVIKFNYIVNDWIIYNIFTTVLWKFIVTNICVLNMKS